jgi:biopolymer transport protein ExbB/TolQ
MVEVSPSDFRRLAQDGALSEDKIVRYPVMGRLAGLGAAPADARHYFLLLRFSLTNLIGFALLGAAWMQGWVDIAWTADTTYLSHGIFVLFLFGLAICGQKIWRTSNELNKARRFDPIHNPEPSLALRYVAEVKGRSGDSRSLAASSLKLKLSTGIGVVRFIANSLVLLGLIGTVVGFIMALSGVDPETSGDAAAITPMVSTLIVGMSVALYTTLIGSVLNVWLMVNFHILASGTVNLVTTLVDLGERHGRA